MNKQTNEQTLLKETVIYGHDTLELYLSSSRLLLTPLDVTLDS